MSAKALAAWTDRSALVTPRSLLAGRAVTRWLLVWILCGTAAACGGDSSPRQVVTRDSAGVGIVESSAPAWADGEGWTVEPNHLLSIGIEDGAREYLLAYAWRPWRLSDGRIIVPNRTGDVIKIYDAGGTYLSEFGGNGGGPGEFETITNVWTTGGDTILVSDRGRATVSTFSPTGDFLNSTILPQPETDGWVLAWFEDGSFVASRMLNPFLRPQVSRDSAELRWYGADDALIRVGGWVGGVRRYEFPDGSDYMFPFSPWLMTAASSDRIVVGHGDYPEVEVLNRDGLVQLIRWQHAEAELGGTEMREFEQMVMEDREENQRPLFRRRLAELAGTHQFPHYAALLLDELGYMWVRQYRWRTDNLWTGSASLMTSGPGDWWVFEPGGAWLGTVRMPEGLDLSQVGADFILGTHRDKLRVERVRVHRLIRDIGNGAPLSQ